MKKSELKKIIKEELKHVLTEDTKATAAQLVALLTKEAGEEFKANFDGAWDRYDIKSAKEITINRGNGFEKAVSVKGKDGGTFLYFGPFKINSFPSETEMLLFYADDGIYIKGL